jgi:hypothetical protein
MDVTELWSSGLRLSDAWWMFGDPYAKERYREAQNRGAMEAREKLMHADLFAGIRNGCFLALGIQVSPAIGNRPELIPEHYFELPDLLDIDWRKSSIRGLGRAYEAVKVVQAPSGGPDTPLKVGPEKLRGRPTVGNELREIVRNLKASGQLDGISRKEQETRVRSVARDRYPGTFPKPNRPSRNTILKALKEAGFGPQPIGPKSP